MNVLFCVHAQYWNSLEKLFHSLLKSKSNNDLKLIFAMIQEGETDNSSCTMEKVHRIVKRPGKDLLLIGKLGRLIKEEKIDIVHSHDPDSVTYSTLAAKLNFKRAVHTQHFRVHKRVANWVLSCNSAIICTSEDLKSDLLRYHHVSAQKIHVIYNGVDIDEIDQYLKPEKRQGLRDDIGLKEEEFVIGNIGRCIREEDQASLIKALKKLVARELNAHLVIAGEGPLKEELVKVAKKYGVSDRVKFYTGNSRHYEVLNIIDCLVMTNFSEGRPHTLLEAMAAKKPVIATSIGANREVVIERQNGYLVPCGFPERIHSAIMRLNAIDSLSSQIGETGRKIVEDKYSLEKMINSYSELYKKVL